MSYHRLYVVRIFFSLSVNLSTYLPVCPIFLSLSPPLSLFVYPSVSMSVCVSVCLYLYVSFRSLLFFCPFLDALFPIAISLFFFIYSTLFLFLFFLYIYFHFQSLSHSLFLSDTLCFFVPRPLLSDYQSLLSFIVFSILLSFYKFLSMFSFSFSPSPPGTIGDLG